MMHPSNNRGVVLLLSLLILSILLSVSLGVFEVIMTGLQLSATSRESQIAFYAADSGVECALYVDLRGSTRFGTTSAPSVLSDCSGASSLEPLGSWANGASFVIKFGDREGTDPCVGVTVDKQSGTKITAVGKNICQENPRRVNRSIQVTY